MCLEVLVQLDASAKNPVGAGSLESLSGLKLKKTKFEGERAFHISTDGTCSCGLLCDESDPDADCWTLAEGRLEALAMIVETLRAEKVRFRFLVHWLGGERQRGTATVKPFELSNEIRRNQIRNNAVYDVHR